MRRRPALPPVVAALAAALLLVPACGGPALAQTHIAPPRPQPPPQPTPLPQAVPAQPQQPVDERSAFNSTEQWLIPHYFAQIRDRQNRAGRQKEFERALPAGLQQPPGKGDILPPAIRAEMPRLPGPLVRELPPRRPDTERLIAGKDVLLVRASTGEVLDIIGDVIY